MGWMDFNERAKALRDERVNGEYRCDAEFCGKVIPYSEMPVVDPKGGYLPKPSGTPNFMPRKPKRTFHLLCDQILRKKRSQSDYELLGKGPIPKVQEKKSPQKEPKVENNGHASKKLMKVVEMVTEAMKTSPKKTGAVWDIIQHLKEKAKMADVRAACRYLKSEGRIQKRNGVLTLKRTKP